MVLSCQGGSTLSRFLLQPMEMDPVAGLLQDHTIVTSIVTTGASVSILNVGLTICSLMVAHVGFFL